MMAMMAAVLVRALPSFGQSTEDLARAAQNPVADMSSLPLQLNTTFNYGIDGLSKRDTQYVLNIQPVVPFKLNEDWIVITRTILPVLSQPLAYGDGSPIAGIANLQETLFFSPAKPGKIIWGRDRRFRSPRRPTTFWALPSGAGDLLLWFSPCRATGSSGLWPRTYGPLRVQTTPPM